jgi:predicted site-specific integrase-resolvase
MRKHVKVCKGWGGDILKAADEAKNADEVRNKIIGRYMRDGTISTAFERKGKGRITYSHRQYTREETQ